MIARVHSVARISAQRDAQRRAGLCFFLQIALLRDMPMHELEWDPVDRTSAKGTWVLGSFWPVSSLTDCALWKSEPAVEPTGPAALRLPWLLARRIAQSHCDGALSSA
jgi:hypothetical protein